MSRTLLGVGASGNLVKQIQQALVVSGCSLTADGVYGQGTCVAVKEFQERNALPMTGTVEDSTWAVLIKCASPTVGERCLHLTAAFEGHGFELAMGDFDGAMLTWGIIGFTMKSGEVQKIVGAINAAYPELVRNTFGEHYEELLQLVEASSDFQKQWASAHTLNNGMLVQPWQTMFAILGGRQEVQAEQLRRVQQNYLAPAIQTAKRLGFSTELGLALCFDIQVQSGGIRARVLKSIQQQFGSEMPELERRKVLANAAADAARPPWKEDVRSRKLTVATGEEWFTAGSTCLRTGG